MKRNTLIRKPKLIKLPMVKKPCLSLVTIIETEPKSSNNYL